MDGRNLFLRLLYVVIYLSPAVFFQSFLSACSKPSVRSQRTYKIQFSPALHTDIIYSLHVKQIMSQQISSIPSAFMQNIRMTWHGRAMARDSGTILLMQCERFFIRSQGKDMDIVYDSDDSVRQETGLPQMEGIVNRPALLWVKPNGRTQLMSDSSQTPPVDLEAFERSTPLFCRFPDTAVTLGSRWEADYISATGFIPIQVHCNYTLMAIRDGKAALAMNALLKTLSHTSGQQLFVARGSGYQKGSIEVRVKDGVVTNSSFVQFLSGEMDMRGLKVPFSQGAEIRITGTVEQ